MTAEEKKLLLREINNYIKENCYYTSGALKYNDLWLAGWVAEEFDDPKNAMKVLIRNDYGLLGNLLYELSKTPDASITEFMEKADLAVLLKALELGGSAVLWRNNLQTNAYAMSLLLKHDIKYLKEVSASLLKSKSFLLRVCEFYPAIVEKAFREPLEDEQFVFALGKKNYMCLRFLPPKFCKDYNFCLAVAQENGFSLMYFDLAIRNCDEIVLAAVMSRGNALSMALPHQKENRDIVYAAVQNSGLALSYAHPLLQNDFEIVSTAVATHGIALRYASQKLRDCEEIVRIAVENDGYALQSASERLRNHYDLAVKAIRTCADAYKYLSPELQNHPEIKNICLLKKEEENKWLPSKMQ